MKKKRKRRTPSEPAAGPPPPNVDAASLSALLKRYALGLFAIATLAYFLVFFTAPAPDLAQRLWAGEGETLNRMDMSLLLWARRLPFVWGEWTGNSIANIGIADRLGVASVAGVIGLCALIVGWLLLDLLAVNRLLTRLETGVFSMGVGLNVVSLLTLLIGLLGQTQNLLVYTIPVALMLLCAGLRFRRRVFQNGEIESNSNDRTDLSRDWLPTWMLWLGFPFVLIIFAGSMTPPTQFDVREYHLQAPKEWFQQGAITFMPHNVYANMPLGPQILSLPAMAIMPGEQNWWWGALAGKLLIAMYVPLTALALFACGRRFFSTTAGVVAALVYISIPWMAHVSIDTYVDGALACNLFLAFYAVMLCTVSPLGRTGTFVAGPNAATGKSAHRTIALAGFLAGAAVSCKYPGLLFVVAPLTLILLLASGIRHCVSPANLSRAGVFLLAVLLGCGLWLGKNWVLTGNPTYPLLYSVFGGETRTPEKDAQWCSAHAVPRDDYGRRYTLGQIGDAIEQVAVSNPWMSPLLVPLAGLALFHKRFRRQLIFIGGLFVFVLAAWFLLTHRIDRFWLPALPLLALAAGVGVTTLDGPWWRRVVIALLFWGLAWNFLVIAGLNAPPNMLVKLASLKNDRPRVHAAHVWLNEHVKQGKTVLLVGDAQPFDLQMPALYNTCFDDCVFEELIKGKSKEERVAALRKRNISHIFVQWSEIDRYRSPGNYGFTDYVTAEIFRELVADGVLGKPLGRKIKGTELPDRSVGEIYPVNSLGE